MPQNFPDIWLKRVIASLIAAVVAPWLDGIPELDADVTELGAGSAGETNVINVPVSTFKPDVLINNSTYPIALQDYNDDTVVISLDKYQTKVTTLSDDQIVGAAYNKIDTATRSHTEAITETKYAKALHALAPQTNSTATPVLTTTGAADASGRKIMTYDDLVALKKALDKAGAPKVGRRLVLCNDHWNDMLLDRKNFGDQMVNYKQGDVAPVVAGFEIFQHVLSPVYSTGGAKVPFAAVAPAGAMEASIAFVKDNVAKKTGLTKQYFRDAKSDPETQTNKLNYRHYFIAVPFLNKWSAAIYSGV